MNSDNNKNLEYKDKCLKIVQKYIEIENDDIDGNLIKYNINEFINDCNYLNKSYYDDLIEERSSIDYCGYTLCNNRLSNTSKRKFKLYQNYHIKNNKVYDISRRKNFCSDQCFKKCEYIRNQISNEPYFMRNNEDLSTKQIQLYNGNDGQIGDELKLIDPLTTKVDEHKQTTKQKEFNKNLLKNQKKIESKISAPYLKEEEFVELKKRFKNFNIQEKFVDENDGSQNQFITNVTKNEEGEIKNENNYDENLPEEIDRLSISTASSLSNLSTQKAKLKKEKFLENIVKKMSLWITDDTRNLLGIDQIKTEHKLQEIEDEDEEKKMERYRWEYIRICARLNEEEIEDENYDQLVLREQSKKQNKKSNKKSVIINNKNDDIDKNSKNQSSDKQLWNLFTNPALFSNENQNVKKVRFVEDTEKNDKEKQNDDDEVYFLPLNDNHHINVKRKQIFLQEIHSILQEILQDQNFIESNDDLYEQIHLLIKTFNLNSNTITLGRKENFIIVIFLLRLLIRYQLINEKFTNKMDNIYKTNILINKILENFNLTHQLIDKNIDNIIFHSI